MSDEKRVLVLDKYEHNMVLSALNDKRNSLIKEQKSTDLVNEVLLKTVDAPVKRFFKAKGKNEDRSR